jgi:RNA polymerase sigma factor for flagellar operon FliA
VENDDERTAIEQLWADYKSSRSRDARDRLIIHYSPLVKYVAGRVAVGLPPNIDQAHQVTYGIVGVYEDTHPRA